MNDKNYFWHFDMDKKNCQHFVVKNSWCRGFMQKLAAVDSLNTLKTVKNTLFCNLILKKHFYILWYHTKFIQLCIDF